ncbi:MAG: ABC transporter ATP-binding protein [Acutalibacteraceae bacterium]
MSKKALEVNHVSIKFNLSKEKVDSIKEYAIKFLKRQLKYNEFWALRDVSFTLNKGDRLGILGLNGAGKSTLLKVVAGVYKPTLGEVKRHGRIAPLIELGAGFDQQYTGKENIFLYGSVLGFSRSFLEEKYDEIVEFSELGEFIDVPMKNYSSGMRSRLGFAIATVVCPDILILDEVLSVGDAKFRKKSEAKIMSMFDKGVTVLFVSHSVDQVERLCNKAILLEKGRIIASGDVFDVTRVYREKTGETKGAKAGGRYRRDLDKKAIKESPFIILPEQQG